MGQGFWPLAPQSYFLAGASSGGASAVVADGLGDPAAAVLAGLAVLAVLAAVAAATGVAVALLAAGELGLSSHAAKKGRAIAKAIATLVRVVVTRAA
jgi:hypothetical protein